MSDVTDLLAKQAISEALYRYCRSLDRMDRPLASTVWHPGATVDYGADIYQGTAEGFLDWVWQAHTRFVAHSHQIANVLTVVDGDTAASEAYVTVTLRTKPDEGRVLDRVARGRYLDSWALRDGLWAIVRRRHVIDIRSAYEMPEEVVAAPTASARDRTDPSYEVPPNLT